MTDDDRGFAFDDHLVISNSELLPGKSGMAFPDLLQVRRCGSLDFTFDVQASLEPVAYVKEVESDEDEDDEFNSKTMEAEVEDESGGGGYGRDGNDSVLLGIVRYDLDYQPRAHAGKTDAKVAEMSSEDEYIDSHSYQVTPKQSDSQDYMRQHSDDIQIAARLHPAEQQLKARSTATRQEEEHPKPIRGIRPPVLSGLGISSPLRNSWTINDI
jgi:hypothetical protein